jgi:universal stress protein A
MTLYRHLLLAADFSDDYYFVADKARALAQVFKAHLSIVHVLDNIAMPDTGYGTIISLQEESGYAALEQEKKRLLALSERLDIDTGHCWLIWGAPETEIIALAEHLAVDLIVVGSHHSKLAFLWGSTAETILKKAQCDVLGVKAPEEFSLDQIG